MTLNDNSHDDPQYQALRQDVEQNPEDPHPAKDLVAYLVAEGHQPAAVKTLHKAFQRLEGLLLPEQLHKPIMTTMMDQGMLEPIEMVVCDLEQRYDVDDDITIKRLVRKGRREIRKRFGIFSDQIKGEDWWREGPHLLSEKDHEDWFPGNVQTIREGVVSIQIWGHTDHNCLNSFMVQLKKGNITDNDGEIEEGTSVEVGISEGGEMTVQVHPDS